MSKQRRTKKTTGKLANASSNISSNAVSASTSIPSPSETEDSTNQAEIQLLAECWQAGFDNSPKDEKHLIRSGWFQDNPDRLLTRCFLFGAGNQQKKTAQSNNGLLAKCLSKSII